MSTYLTVRNQSGNMAQQNTQRKTTNAQLHMRQNKGQKCVIYNIEFYLQHVLQL